MANARRHRRLACALLVLTILLISVSSLISPTWAQAEQSTGNEQNQTSCVFNNTEVCRQECCSYCRDSRCCESNPSGSACRAHSPQSLECGNVTRCEEQDQFFCNGVDDTEGFSTCSTRPWNCVELSSRLQAGGCAYDCSARVKDMYWGHLQCQGTWRNTGKVAGCFAYLHGGCGSFCNGKDLTDGLYTCAADMHHAMNCSELEVQNKQCSRNCSYAIKTALRKNLSCTLHPQFQDLENVTFNLSSQELKAVFTGSLPCASGAVFDSLRFVTTGSKNANGVIVASGSDGDIDVLSCSSNELVYNFSNSFLSRIGLLTAGESARWTKLFPTPSSPIAVRIYPPIGHDESGNLPGVALEVPSGAQNASLSYLDDTRMFYQLLDATIQPSVTEIILVLTYSVPVDCTQVFDFFVQGAESHELFTFSHPNRSDLNMSHAAFTCGSCNGTTVELFIKDTEYSKLVSFTAPKEDALLFSIVHVRRIFRAVHTHAIIVPQQSVSLSFVSDTVSPCPTSIEITPVTNVMVIRFTENLFTNVMQGADDGYNISSNGLANISYGDHLSITIKANGESSRSVGSDARIIQVQTASTNALAFIKIDLDLRFRPNGQEIVEVDFFRNKDNGVTDYSGNTMCLNYPADVATAKRLHPVPGVLVNPLEIQVGEGEPSGADEGFGATVTLRLATPPSTADVTVRIYSSDVEPVQVVVSPTNVTFALDEDSWSAGISVTVTAVKDGVTENDAGSNHWSDLRFEIVQGETPDAEYSSNMTQLYGNDSLPTVVVTVLDPVPLSIAPPQILEARFDPSLTKVVVTFDSETNGKGVIPCERVLTTTSLPLLGEKSGRECTWVSRTEFEISLGYDASVRQGSNMRLNDGVVIGACTHLSKDGNSCKNRRRACDGCYTPVQLPIVEDAGGKPTGESFSLYPKIITSYNKNLGFCDDLVVDLGSSKGSGPYSWDAVTVETLSCKGQDVICTGDSDPTGNATIDKFRMQILMSRKSFALGTTGEYVFRVTLVNIIGETVFADVPVNLVADALPTFSIAGAAERTILRTLALTLTVSKVELPCGGSAGSLKILWTNLTGVPTGATDMNDAMVVPVTVVDPTNVKIRGSHLSSGYTYSITGSASLGNSTTIRTESTIKIHVAYSPLIAIITPPGLRTIGMNETVTLDGSKSMDPDDSGNMTYTWNCGDCPGPVQSLLTAKSANETTNYAGESHFELVPGFFRAGLEYQISLQVGVAGVARNNSKTTDATLKVETGNPPGIRLIGPSSLNPNANHPLVVEAQVQSCCFGANFGCSNYSVAWRGNLPSETLDTENMKALYVAEPQMFLSDPHKLTDQDTFSGYRAYKVIVSPKTLHPGSEYSFSLTVIDPCGISTAMLPIIRMNAPPTGGSIHVSPESGNALGSQETTTFVLSAPGWVDPEAALEIDSPLMYKFVYLKDPFDLNSQRVQIKTVPGVSSYSTELGKGQGEYGMVMIGVVVMDVSGAFAESSFQMINVTAEPLPENTTAQEEFYDSIISESIEPFESKSQSQEVYARLDMIGSSLEDADEGVKTKMTAKLVDIAFRSSATLVNDESSIELQAQFLNTVSNNNVDDSTMEKMLSVTESLASSSESLGTITKSTTDALTNTLSSLLFTVTDAAAGDDNLGSSSAGGPGSAPSGTSGGNGGNSGNGGSGGTGSGSVDNPGGGAGSTEEEEILSQADVERVNRLRDAVTSVVSAVATGMVSGAEPVSLVTPSFSATMTSSSSSALAKDGINASGGVSVTVPPGAFANVSEGSDVQSLVLNFNDPPSLDNGTTTIASGNVRMVLKSDGKTMRVSDLDKPIKLKLPFTAKTRKNATSRGVLVGGGEGNKTEEEEMPSVEILCRFVGENIIINNCSDPHSVSNAVYPKSFNITCTTSMVSNTTKTLFTQRVVCPKMIVLPECVYWSKANNSWEQDGLTTVFSNATGEITCESTHLTDFSVKLVSSLSAVDDILASPFSKEVNNAEELFALLAENATVVLSMLVLLFVFVSSCFMSHYIDSIEDFEARRDNAIHVRNVWSASRGIISWRQLEMDVGKSHWLYLWIEGIKAYHPLLSIWYTHTLAINRPQRVMILTVMLTANMFINAMFWNARYPDPDAMPLFEDTLLFGMIAAALNFPIIKVSEELYKRVGAATVLHQKYMLLGKYLLKSNYEEADRRLCEEVKTGSDALAHLHMVQGAVEHVEHELDSHRTRVALTRRGSTMQKMQQLHLEEKKVDVQNMRHQLERARQVLQQKRQEETIRKKNAIKKLGEKLSQESSCSCVGWFRSRAAYAQIHEKYRLSEMNVDERALTLVLKKKNFLVNQLFEVNRDQRDPKLHESTMLPWWSGSVVDLFAFSLVLFFCYFIVAFGMYYGADVASSWLQAFLLAVVTDFFAITPIVVFFRVVVLPRLVLWTVFENEPSVAHLGNTPLMSGAVDAIGPTSRTAFAMGLSSVANVGSTGAKARRWLNKARESGRHRRHRAKIKYVWDGAGGVRTVLVNVDDKKRTPISKYVVTPGKSSSSENGYGGMAHAATSELREAHRRRILQRWRTRQEVTKQTSIAAQQVNDELSDRHTLDLVLKLLITELSNTTTLPIDLGGGGGSCDGGDRGGSDVGASGDSYQQKYTFSNFRDNDDALMAFLMELVMDEVLDDLRPKGTSGTNGYTQEEIARAAAQASNFMTSMAVNRVQNDRSMAAQKQANNDNVVRKDRDQKKRAAARKKKAAAAAAGASEFPVELVPSDIISRARKRLIRFQEPEKTSVVDHLVQNSPLASAMPKTERDDLLRLVPPGRDLQRQQSNVSGKMPSSRISQMSDYLELAEEKNRASMLAAMLLNTE